MLGKSAKYLIFMLIFAIPGLSGADTLKRISKSGEIRLGYRTDSFPLAFDDSTGQAAGYSVDLCRRIAAAVKEHLKMDELKVNFVPLKSDNRIEAVVRDKVDIECGSSTITLSRLEKVDFTLMTFVTGGSVITKAGAGVQEISDLTDKSVAVIKGTTTESSLTEHLSSNLIDAKVVHVENREAAMKQLDAGQVDAFASDQIVLIGLLMQSANPNQYAISPDLFSFEPYGLMVKRNDADFRIVANRALAMIYRSGQYQELYGKWFGRSGVRPSPILVAMYRVQALPE